MAAGHVLSVEVPPVRVIGRGIKVSCQNHSVHAFTPALQRLANVAVKGGSEMVITWCYIGTKNMRNSSFIVLHGAVGEVS